ncbi:DNA-binding transcriptional regulator [Microvirga sp. WGZ8]|uniref:DNA-binding transcriptional regulator n=2 Tax=Microvirga puerhi TaxID=2876078 RepID=A0ABS7VUY9_9HYPH|nr:DNA-binding transcriptional regulator [Microvirga puerhi]MBZ6078961.1 DNA-binding transcriptional regulator [Microvirga puerhi]
MNNPRKTYRSDPLRSVHLAMKGLHQVGAIDKATMRHFDVACLTTVDPIEPDDVKRIREKSHMSQATFAKALNVTAAMISKWERGEKKPTGSALKLLALADKKGIETIL